MPVANLNDMQTLATDPVFGNRVQMALIQYCTTVVPTEAVRVSGSSSAAPTPAEHQLRKNYAANALNNPAIYKPFFVLAVAANQIVANDATATATIVGLQGAALAAQALLCTDTDINNAVAAAFNAFIGGI